MNCFEFHQLLQLRLDGEVFDRRGWDRHIGECAECRLRDLAVQQLEAGLQRHRPCAPPPSLAGRIADQILAEQRVIRRYRRGLATAALVAASLVLAAYAGTNWLWPRQHGVAPSEPGVARVPPAATVPAPSFDRSVEEAGVALVGLVGRTAGETVDTSRFLLPGSMPGTSAAGFWQAPLEPPVQSLREAGQGVSQGLEPVATSARRAVNLFFGEIKPSKSERKSG
jgi:hypothetical protein